MTRRLILFAPLAVLLLFIAAVGWRLASPPETIVRSKLEGRPVPAFTLEPMGEAHPGLSSADLATGKPRLLNIFASWCVPCIAEAPVLMELKRRGVAIDAIAVRDREDSVREFLARHGDPFERLGDDPQSRVQLALGSSGVPESFVIDGRGVIRLQHVGPIGEAEMPAILSALEQAR